MLLFQCVASHPDTKLFFMKGKSICLFILTTLNIWRKIYCLFIIQIYLFWYAANIPIYLYPFLNTSNKLAPFEDLRLASLGVIAAMVKVLFYFNFFLHDWWICLILFLYVHNLCLYFVNRNNFHLLIHTIFAG